MGCQCIKGNNTAEGYLPPTLEDSSEVNQSILSTNISVMDDNYKSSVVSQGVFSNDPNYSSREISIENF